MLDVFLKDEVEDPVEAEERVDKHGTIVPSGILESKVVAEEGVFGVGVEERPIHDEIPKGGINGVDGSKDDEESLHVGI